MLVLSAPGTDKSSTDSEHFAGLWLHGAQDAYLARRASRLFICRAAPSPYLPRGGGYAAEYPRDPLKAVESLCAPVANTFNRAHDSVLEALNVSRRCSVKDSALGPGAKLQDESNYAWCSRGC